MSDLADAIEALTFGRVTVGDASTDKISTTQLSILESGTVGTVSRMDPGFQDMELAFFKARIILDLYVNSSGSGQILDKTVKDSRWKVAQAKSTSVWMDQALQQIEDFLKPRSFTTIPSGVSRCDAEIKGLDSTTIKQYGWPSNAL